MLAALLVITNLPHRPGTDAAVRFSSSTASPGPAQNGDTLQTPPPLRGDAPWALSALPECFHQDAQRSGPPAFARASFPPAAVPVAPGTRLRVADCTLDVAARSAVVRRGDNRLVVPPLAKFFVSGRTLILDRIEGKREDVRSYSLHGGAAPSFEPQP